ncbi:PPOX class probable FMN-dependent enzyme [Conyzicola lurida]|uniref:PPOX class probable FMN-dependent enzyme n=1 Tax=Conyzicola lurida TaxID=1172621 RepID=A0A841AQ64_9MICO|nr:MSMEG_1061 family FMN-dependent PPOX-type flavoprotein [Conyzicola lurida]MBB5844092.1 PPOX class probable FMN-dependent enzyme [Conyzicola lurida]
MTERGTAITTVEELESVVGTPTQRAADKVRRELHEMDLRWLAGSSLVFIATSDGHGNLDVSPKGDPAGFVTVLDNTTIAIPDRPGNRRVDGFRNILVHPYVGLVFLVPGRGDTLRINGRATIVRDAPFFDEMVVREHRPDLAIVVDIEEVFFHCSKAFLRSQAWDPAVWDESAVPRRAEIARAVERPGDSIEVIEEHYGPKYAESIYLKA